MVLGIPNRGVYVNRGICLLHFLVYLLEKIFVMKLDSEAKVLLSRTVQYTDEALLSWAGYENRRAWEEDHDEKFTRSALIFYNFEDIKHMIDLYEEEEQYRYQTGATSTESSSKVKKHRRTWSE